jgi:hypothetical protein
MPQDLPSCLASSAVSMSSQAQPLGRPKPPAYGDHPGGLTA